ncbi:HAMP domain-containing protein [Chloroflexia bacterium SDU3-3]|nr:HAMP domain-containing protein [Chloroflexia bacterium SDU3-3]
MLAWLPLLGVSWFGLQSLATARATAEESTIDALRRQTENSLAERAADKAKLYNSTLDHIQQQVESVAGYANTLIAAGPPTEGGGERVWVVPGGATPRNLANYPETVARARQITPLIRTMVARNQLISLGYVAFETGGVIAFNQDIIDKLPYSFDPRDRPWYKAAKTQKGTVWADTYVDANTLQLVTTCATPLYDTEGRVIGVVGFDILLQTIQQDLLQTDIGAQGGAFLLNSDGQVLVAPQMRTDNLQWNEQFRTENLLDSDDPRLRSVVNRMVNGETGIKRLMVDQDDIYLAYAPVNYSGWSVGIIYPESAISGPAKAVGSNIATQQDDLRNQVAIILLLSLIALPVVGATLTLWLTRPLRRLQLGAQRVAAGNFSHQIAVESNDEIGDLVRSFNSMSVALGQQVDELEDNLHRLATLNEVSNRFKTIVSLPELLDMIPRSVCDDLGFDRAALYLAEGSYLRCIAASFGKGNEQQAIDFIEAANNDPVSLEGSTIEADIMRSGQAVIIDNPWEHPKIPQAKQEVAQSESYVQVPIFGHDEVIIGLLSADYQFSQREITPRDAAQLLTYASVVGLTIENTKLYNHLEQQVTQRTTELRAAMERAQEADKLKTQFLAAISHELRTPLNAIIGFSTVMLDELDGPITSMQREDLRTINQNGRVLLHLINELLDLARIEANRVEISPESFALSEVVGEVTDTVQGLIVGKPIKIHASLPSQSLRVYADRAKTRQVLLNLLSNAVKFTSEGTVAITARPMTMMAEGTQQPRTFIAIGVRDTGIGIAPEHFGEIFEEFRQVHAGRTGARGSGLGLAITRKFVELMGGQIWVESELGQGSTFTFTLPVPELGPHDPQNEAAQDDARSIMDGTHA